MHIGNDCSNVQPQLLRVHLGTEDVRDARSVARLDLMMVAVGRQVSNDSRTLGIEVWRPEAAANKSDQDGFGFFITELQRGLCGSSVDQFDAEDFCVWELRRHCHLNGWSCAWILDLFRNWLTSACQSVCARSGLHKEFCLTASGA